MAVAVASSAALKPTSAAVKSAAARLAYVDGLRALAALYVLVSHIGQTLWWQRPTPANLPLPLQWLAGFAGVGQDAVAVFIVLSGYSLTLPVARAGWRISDGALGFYRRRAWRILPPYYAAMALSLLLIWLAIGRPSPGVWGQMAVPVGGWADVVSHVLLLQDFTARSSINYVFWSIAVECQIYLTFPGLVWLWRRYDHRFCLALCLGLAFVFTLAARLTGWQALFSPVGSQFLWLYAGLFAVGMFAAGARMSARYAWDVVALVALGLLCAGATRWPFYQQDALVGLLAVALLHARLLRRVLLEWRPLVWIGGFSYSLYLIHAPLLQLLWQYGVAPQRWTPSMSYVVLLMLGVPLIVLAAWGFHLVAERPFMSGRRQSAASPRASAHDSPPTQPSVWRRLPHWRPGARRAVHVAPLTTSTTAPRRQGIEIRRT